MAFRGKCEICSGTNFNVEDGYYYCSECNTQNKTAMQMECDAMDLTMGDENIKVRGVKLKEEKGDKIELTSWEEYNYILLGLVNEAIALGAPITLKKTVLQLWTRYLQKVNAAFFSKTEPQLPKLPVTFHKQDASILYNMARKRTRSRSTPHSKSSASGSTKSRRVIKIARTKTKKALMKSFESFSSNEPNHTDTSMTLGSESFTTISPSTKSGKSGKSLIPLEFTSNARRALKRCMSKNHIKKHTQDSDRSLLCHKKKIHDSTKMSERLETVSKNVLLSLLYIGLNLTKSEIQLGDMRRFMREGHLSIFRVDHFFPENILKHMNRSSFIKFTGRYNLPTHPYLRKVTIQLCAQLGVRDLVLPDFVSLTKRYIKELCLPDELGKFIERLITFRPPEMKCPKYGLNYEARAIAYVIFLLKWLFGVDGSSEKVMSKATQEINEYLNEENIPHLKLFNFEEWMKYIEMRSIILIECHEPTNVAMGMQEEDNTQRYLDFLDHCERPGKSAKKSIGAHIYNIYETLSTLHGEAGENRKVKSFLFPPSMTPFRSYMEDLLENHSHELNIPRFMATDHSQRTIDPFLRPCRFRKQLRSSQVDLCVEVCPENIEIVNVATVKTKKLQGLLVVKIVEQDEECDYKEELWNKETPKIPKKKTKEPKKDIKIPSEAKGKKAKRIARQNARTLKALIKKPTEADLARKAAMAQLITKLPLNTAPEKDHMSEISEDESMRSSLSVTSVASQKENNDLPLSKDSAKTREDQRKLQISRSSDDRSVLVPLITRLSSENLHGLCEKYQKDLPATSQVPFSQSSKNSTKRPRKDQTKMQISQSSEDKRSDPDSLNTRLPSEPSEKTAENQKDVEETSQKQTEIQKTLSQFLDNVLDTSKVPSDVPASLRGSLLSTDLLPESHLDPGDEILRMPRRNLESMTMFDNMSDGDDEDSPQCTSTSRQMEFFTPHFKYWHHFIVHTSGEWDLHKDVFNELLEKLPASFTWLLYHCSIISGMDMQSIYMELLTIEKQFTCVLESVDQMSTMLVLKKKSSDDPSRHFRHTW